MLLTPKEYDEMPAEVKAALAAVNRQPSHDRKSASFRKRHGAFLNGELYADPLVASVTGYGTGSRLVPA